MQTARKQLLVANWKMNPRALKDAQKLFAAVKKELTALKGIDVVITPPTAYLTELRRIAPKGFIFGAQDVCEEKEGAYTGGISASMLKSLGVTYVIVGHSERRARGETDAIVAKKVKTAVNAGLSVILCVGEAERDQGGKYFGLLEQQVRLALGGLPRTKLGHVVIAYEPVWAISTTENAKPATADDVHEMTLYIKKVLAGMYGRAAANVVPVLYGGSVTPKNINELVERGEVAGYLVGGTSLRPKDFGAVARRIHEER